MMYRSVLCFLVLLTPALVMAQTVPVPQPSPKGAQSEAPVSEPTEESSAETAKPEPPRIYQAACPAVLSGWVVAKSIPPIEEGQCGERSPLAVTAINGVQLSAPTTMNCRMATTLAEWIEDAQPVAQETVGAGIAKILSSTGYQCRRRNNLPDGKISEHGFANAFDILGFELENSRQIIVLEDWVGEDGESLYSTFLKSVHAKACERFTTVLGPDSDPHHTDHFHFDLGCHGKTCTYKICD